MKAPEHRRTPTPKAFASPRFAQKSFSCIPAFLTKAVKRRLDLDCVESRVSFAGD
jgi:hypothetical protein